MWLTNNNVYRYKGRISDQSHLSGTVSLELMTPAEESRARGFKPQSWLSTGNVYLPVYFSSY